MYVIREMEDAVADCKAGCEYCNDARVHAWDEAVAFYTGSIEEVLEMKRSNFYTGWLKRDVITSKLVKVGNRK